MSAKKDSPAKARFAEFQWDLEDYMPDAEERLKEGLGRAVWAVVKPRAREEAAHCAEKSGGRVAVLVSGSAQDSVQDGGRLLSLSVLIGPATLPVKSTIYVDCRGRQANIVATRFDEDAAETIVGRIETVATGAFPLQKRLQQLSTAVPEMACPILTPDQFSRLAKIPEQGVTADDIQEFERQKKRLDYPAPETYGPPGADPKLDEKEASNLSGNEPLANYEIVSIDAFLAVPVVRPVPPTAAATGAARPVPPAAAAAAATGAAARRPVLRAVRRAASLPNVLDGEAVDLYPLRDAAALRDASPALVRDPVTPPRRRPRASTTGHECSPVKRLRADVEQLEERLENERTRATEADALAQAERTRATEADALAQTERTRADAADALMLQERARADDAEQALAAANAAAVLAALAAPVAAPPPHAAAAVPVAVPLPAAVPVVPIAVPLPAAVAAPQPAAAVAAQVGAPQHPAAAAAPIGAWLPADPAFAARVVAVKNRLSAYLLPNAGLNAKMEGKGDARITGHWRSIAGTCSKRLKALRKAAQISLPRLTTGSIDDPANRRAIESFVAHATAAADRFDALVKLGEDYCRKAARDHLRVPKGEKVKWTQAYGDAKDTFTRKADRDMRSIHLLEAASARLPHPV